MNIINRVIGLEKFFKKKDIPLLEQLATLPFTKKIKKGDHILHAGDVNRHIFYVQSGLFRVYLLNDDKEVNTWFVKEGDFITSIGSFHNGTPSEHYIDAIEDSEVVTIKKSSLEFITKNYHKAALFAIEEVKEERKIDMPVMVSGTITDASGRTLSGQTAEAFLISVSHLNLLSVGFNCALGANQLTPYLETLAHNSDFFVSAYPNAGLPNAFGQYDQTPEEMQQLIREYLQENLVNIIGGCCGTTPDHIKAIAELAKNYQPRLVTVEL